MSWGRVDDKLHSHPKIKKIAKRTDALGAWVRMLSWSSDYGTNGHIPTEVALDFATQGVLDRLVEVRMLDNAEDGYSLHNFGAYNPGPASAEAKRSEISEKRREAGKRGASSRWGAGTDGNGDGKPDGKEDGNLPSPPDGKPDAKPMATDSPTRGRALGDPIPIPIPDPEEDNNNPAGVREGTPGERPWSVGWCVGEIKAAASEDPTFDDGDLSELERPALAIAKRLAALPPEHRFLDLRAEAATWFIHGRSKAAEAATAGRPWSRARVLTEVETKASFRLANRPKDSRAERDRARNDRRAPTRVDIFDQPIPDEPEIDESLYPRTVRRHP